MFASTKSSKGGKGGGKGKGGRPQTYRNLTKEREHFAQPCKDFLEGNCR